jgi:hypothetical protein
MMYWASFPTSYLKKFYVFIRGSAAGRAAADHGRHHTLTLPSVSALSLYQVITTGISPYQSIWQSVSSTEILQSEPSQGLKNFEVVVERARGPYKYKNEKELACKHENESIKSYRIICNVPSNSMHAPPKLKNIHIYLTLFPRGTLAIWQVVKLMFKIKT